MQRIRISAALLGIVCATLFGACVEDEDPPFSFGYCFDAYSDCLDDCSGSGCHVCEAEYNNCVEMTGIYR